MTSIELTEEQRRVIEAEQGRPVDVIDPATNRAYVLVVREQYEKVRSLLSPQPATVRQEEELKIAAGILRSQQAFWRDLPHLLAEKKLRGKWVCYQGDERVGIGKYEDLIRECVRRGIPDDEYDLFVIRPHELPPWEPEEVEPLGPHHLDGYASEP